MDIRSHHHHRRGKCCGMRVEKMCYIFAIINWVTVSVFVLACFAMQGFLLGSVISNLIEKTFTQFLSKWFSYYLIYAVICVTTAIYGVFSVLLLQGIRLNKPELVMAYLLCGLVVEIFMIAATSVLAACILTNLGKNYWILYSVAVAVILCEKHLLQNSMVNCMAAVNFKTAIPISNVAKVISLLVVTLLTFAYFKVDLESLNFSAAAVYDDTVEGGSMGDSYMPSQEYFEFAMKIDQLIRIWGVIFFLCYLSSFIFSVLLCYGIHKRQPIYLKAYLVHGVATTICMCMCLVYIYFTFSSSVGLFLLGIPTGMYVIFLRMVHWVYLKYDSEKYQDLPLISRL